MRHLESVEVADDCRSHWRVAAPGGTTVEWDAEIVDDEPNRRIGWRTLPGAAVPNRGAVEFRRAPGDRGTEIVVELEYEPPAAAAGAAVAKLFGKEAGQQVETNLRRLKQILETGDVPTAAGPSARRRPSMLGQGETAMKATCWMGKKHVSVVPDPRIEDPRDAIVRITSTAICGSDLHLYNGFVPTMERGDILGHEFMGEVVEVGQGVTNLAAAIASSSRSRSRAGGAGPASISSSRCARTRTRTPGSPRSSWGIRRPGSSATRT